MANNASISNISVDLTELSADTSPQLGGNLDLNSNDITGTGNVNTTGTITSSGAITGYFHCYWCKSKWLECKSNESSLFQMHN